jgi:Uncharacterized protein conserved in bacteria
MMQDVRPLKEGNRADLVGQKKQSSSQGELPIGKRRCPGVAEELAPNFQNAAAETAPFAQWDRELPPELQVAAEEELFYIQDQLPHATLKKFRKGSLCSSLEIDLHGLTSKEASNALAQFMQEVLQQRVRCFRLIHGKGNRSATEQPILKNRVNQWLRQQPEVLAFCSARQRDGGTGALYILLKRVQDEILSGD